MENSFITGFFCLLFLFALSVVIVLGVKYTYFAMLKLFAKPSSQIDAPKKRRRYKKTPVATPQEKPIRSIEINPDEVDKIYVKKVG